MTALRIAVYSDLHLEKRDWRPPRDLAADLVILAGDIAEGAAGIAWAERQFRVPVLYVPGNHEYHGGRLRDLRPQAASRVRLLDRDAVVVAGRLRVLGCTLWTDFRLLEGQGLDRETAMDRAGEAFADYRNILTEEGEAATPPATLSWHERDRRWLAAELAKPFAGPTIVVTHHAPSRRSANPRYPALPLGACFASDLEEMIADHTPAVWIHGHTHHNVDYRLGATRIIANQRSDPAFAGTVTVTV